MTALKLSSPTRTYPCGAIDRPAIHVLGLPYSGLAPQVPKSPAAGISEGLARIVGD